MSDTQVEFTPIEWSTSPDYTGYTLVHAGGQVSLELLSRPDTIKIQVFRLHPASGEGEHRLLLRVRGAAAIITQEHTNGKGFLVQEGESFRMVETLSPGDSPSPEALSRRTRKT
ncbi:MAG: hypothetical protein H6619_04880 [Deltaproteobacteria bacterium]|nr:hypothetical protein [Deltaproteobacteria bacterium]